MKTTKLRRFIFSALFVLTTPPSIARALEDSPERQLSFAEELRTDGETYRAVTEYKRFLHHYPEDPSIPTAMKGLGLAYAQAGRWEDAVSVFHKLSELPESGPDEKLIFGSALYKAQRFNEAIAVFTEPETGDRGALLAELSDLRMGKQTSYGDPEISKEYSALNRKNKTTAGLFSALLPGAGHLYCGRPRDATVSFIVNGAFIWGAYASARNDDWALAGILGFFELGWYSGNVVSAMGAAQKWNFREEERFFNRWEAEALPSWTIRFLPDGLALSSSWSW